MIFVSTSKQHFPSLFAFPILYSSPRCFFFAPFLCVFTFANRFCWFSHISFFPILLSTRMTFYFLFTILCQLASLIFQPFHTVRLRISAFQIFYIMPSLLASYSSISSSVTPCFLSPHSHLSSSPHVCFQFLCLLRSELFS